VGEAHKTHIFSLNKRQELYNKLLFVPLLFFYLMRKLANFKISQLCPLHSPTTISDAQYVYYFSRTLWIFLYFL
jgi:hypothetical protein